MADPRLSALAAFLQGHPNIKYTTPSSAEFASVRHVWNHSRRATPLAVLQPQSAEDVSVLVKYAKQNGIPFTVRAGGHSLEGLAIANGALTIDLRALTAVTVAADRKSATVRGGILQHELATELWKEGLATPLGTMPSVGYVGWAVYGGYGPFSGHWGLGVDQIIGATVVNQNGDIVKADGHLLKGIRGAGGSFGVIVDLTVKVYPLKSLLAGVIMFDAQDITKSFTGFNAAYQKLLEGDGLPPELTIQQLISNAPPARVYIAIFVWSSENIEEGQRWKDKIASLGTVVMNTVAVTTIPDWINANGGLAPSAVYGSSRTHSLHRMTPEVVQVVGRNLPKMPSVSPCMFTIHQLRGPSATVSSSNGASIFAVREPHYMLEILGFSGEEEYKQECEQWASDLADQVEHETDARNILPHAYISLDPTDKRNLARMFGSHAEEVRALKKEYDPDDLFALAVPLLKGV